MSLPTVPPGTNPFTVYKAALDATVYPTPPDGFKVRLGVLFGLSGLLIVLSVVHWLVMFREWRINRRGSPLWLFRLADRASGRYIVTNGKLVLSLFSIITTAVLIGQLYDVWNTYIEHGSQSGSAGIRTWATLPLFMQGWLMPWAALQASILASEHDNKAILSPRVANGLFAGLGGFFFLGLIASNVVNTIAGERVWSQYEKAYGLLSRFEAEWTPTTNVVVPLLQVGPELQELNRRADYNQTCQVATISVWLLIPIIVIMVNLASLRLSRLLHRQVKWNIEHLSQHSIGSGSARKASTSGRASLSAQSAELIKKLRDGRLSVSHLSRSDLMRLASRRGSAPEKERVRHIQALQKAEKDLIVTSYVVLTAILAILGICVYFLYVVAANKVTSSWGIVETSLTATAWIYLVALNLVMLSLLWFHWTSRDIRMDDSMTSWVGGANMPVTSVGSLSQVPPQMSQHDGVDPVTIVDFNTGVVSAPSASNAHLLPKLPASGDFNFFAWPSKEGFDGGNKETRTEILRFADEDEEHARERAFSRRPSEGIPPTAFR
ncbi:uncharacterized protein JCM10292_000990 [Rhodotorula paludigena]|uniref:uncharacterized protein n=1 Tax=Rhodotorula paludigena TaxID=86838 RepID=UPI0031758540